MVLKSLNSKTKGGRRTGSACKKDKPVTEELPIQEIFELVGDMNAEVVGRYFKERGFGTTRLDETNTQQRNCDWFVEPPKAPFLCEVKTVRSVQRGQLAEDPFRRRFENSARHYFANRKDVQGLPYHLHFHSDMLRLPAGNDENKAVTDCLAAVAELLLRLMEKDEQPGLWFSDDRCGGVFDLTISPSRSGRLELEISKYGGINLDAVEDSLSSAIKQVNRSGEDYPGLARMVVLAFASDIVITSNSEVAVFSGLAFREEELWRLVDRVMKRHPELSAVAVMARQVNPHFAVFHNPDVSEVEALDNEVFDDSRSVQFDSLETIPRSQPQPFDPQKLVASIIKTAAADEKYVITVADYEALKSKKRTGS